MTENVTIVIPAYCEAEALPQILPGVLDFACARDWLVIVVDDGSTDGTPGVLQRFAGHPSLSIYRHKLNQGYGAAVKTGLRHVSTPFAVTFDADGQHLLESLDAMHQHIEQTGADLVVGKRQDPAARSVYRSLGKFIIRAFSRLLVPNNIQDLNSGQKMYRMGEALRYLSFCPNSMAFSDVITLVMISRRRLVLEFPVQTALRRAGSSKINAWTAVETLLEILHALILLEPTRFFFPLAGFALLVSLLWGVPIVLAGRGVSVGAMLGIASSLILFAIGLLSEQIARLRLLSDENC